MFNLPAGTLWLLLINVAVFALQLIGGDNFLITYGALWPLASSNFEPWQLLTYSFLHGSPVHLLFNMLALVMFGGDVERVWGRQRFLTYYFVCVLSAGLTQVLFTHLSGSEAETIGASGGVFGVLLAF